METEYILSNRELSMEAARRGPSFKPRFDVWDYKIRKSMTLGQRWRKGRAIVYKKEAVRQLRRLPAPTYVELECFKKKEPRLKMRPSSSDRWRKCPGSVRFLLDYKDTENVYAIQGTQEHAIAEGYLSQNLHRLLDNDEEPNEAELSLMPANVAEYIREVHTTLKDAAMGAKCEVFIEEVLSLDKYIPGGKGIVDCLARIGDEVFVFDYKSGRYKVQPNCSQMLIYALAAHAKFGASTYHLIIVQPAARYGEKQATYNCEELEAFGAILAKSVEEVLAPNPIKKAGAEQCRFCPGRHDCTELANTMRPYYDLLKKKNITDEEFYLLKKNYDLIKNHAKSISEKIEDRLKDGGKFTGAMLSKQVVRTKWSESAEKKLVEVLGDDAYNVKERSMTNLIDSGTLDMEKHKDLFEYQTVITGIGVASSCDKYVQSLPPAKKIRADKTSDYDKIFFMKNIDGFKTLIAEKEEEIKERLLMEGVDGFVINTKSKRVPKIGAELIMGDTLGESSYVKTLKGITDIKKLKTLSKEELAEITEKYECNRKLVLVKS